MDAWECGLSMFQTMEEVPPLFKEKWSRAMATIFRRIQVALKWFLISAQAFLREPRRGGKKGQSRGAVAARFDCWVRGDWGTLLAFFLVGHASCLLPTLAAS